MAIATAVALAEFAIVLSGVFWVDNFSVAEAVTLGVPTLAEGFVIALAILKIVFGPRRGVASS